MTKLFNLTVLFLLLTSTTKAQEPPRPKLVVGIVLDQMRWDYLYRFADRYGEGGFKRLMKGGFNCENTKINYLPSFTGPGHATIYTGTVPALHGIASNDWINNRDFSEMYCTDDSSVQSVGNKGKAGKMSPRNMIANTISDELRLATNFRAKTIGISLKDRGSILPAGHAASGAYWFDGADGQFITSTYYTTALPAWLQRFNARNVVDSLLAIEWQPLYPIHSYVQSSPDDNKFEGSYKGASSPTFPHNFSRFIGKDRGVIRNTPWGNTITRLMAEAAIIGEGLGKDGITDLLALSFSSTDYLGHQFGPNAIEIEDMYLRMDQELALLLQFLDKQVGKGQYTVFLTADHGGAHNVTFLNSHKMPGSNINYKEFSKNMNSLLKTKFGYDNLTIFENYHIYFNNQAIINAKLDKVAIMTEVKKILGDMDNVNFVMDMTGATNNVVPERIREMANNGHYPKRSGDIQIIFNPGDYSGYGPTGTTHGSWNPYDSRIPLLFYGWGIRAGSSFAPYNMTDIAPTLAALLRIQEPNACIGKPITEVLK